MKIEPIKHALFGFAFLAILGVNSVVVEGNGNVFEWNLFPSRIIADRHRSTHSQRGQEIVVRSGRGIAAAIVHRLVRFQMMFAGDHFLEKTTGAAADDDLRRRTVLVFRNRRRSRVHVPQDKVSTTKRKACGRRYRSSAKCLGMPSPINEIRRLPSPATTPQALTWHKGELWMGSRDLRRIYRMNGETVAVIAEIHAPGS